VRPQIGFSVLSRGESRFYEIEAKQPRKPCEFLPFFNFGEI
jgi:hypothetical protein